MLDSINFVRERRRRLTKIEVQDRLWLRWSIMALGVVAVILVVSASIQFILSWQVNSVKAQQDRLKKEVASKVEVERSYVIFSNKLRMLKDIIASRADKQAALRYFTQVFGSEVLLREISFESSKKQVEFSVQAKDIFAFQEVVRILDSPEVTQKYALLERSQLRRGSDGTYEVSVLIKLGQDKAKAAPPATNTKAEGSPSP